MRAALSDLGWWLLWACAVPSAVLIASCIAFRPRPRCWLRSRQAPVRVISVRPVPDELPGSRREPGC